MKYYNSPRWTQEILDCSMPMTFDTYSKCSYNCLYCFAYFQKSHSLGDSHTKKTFSDYQKSNDICWVNPKRIKSLFLLNDETGKANKQFFNYIKDKKVMQWGGLADQFDEYERRFGITLELLNFFKKINYPLCFSTKATWWLNDERYKSLVMNQKNWNCKISIINLHRDRAKKIEIGVDVPDKRLRAIQQYHELCAGGVTLRLRPFLLGLSDRDDEYLELIEKAVKRGAGAVSTEFFCLEGRADKRLKNKYRLMSEVLGYDLFDYYKKNSLVSGYYRLKRAIKYPYIKKMYNLCKKLGVRFYVSDAHFKEYSNNGSCCGLTTDWNYYRGQFTEALMIAKNKGTVHFSDIADECYKYMDFEGSPCGFNTICAAARALHKKQSMYDYIREVWNSPNTFKSPYKYFAGVLIPIGLDKKHDVIYKYKPYKSRKTL